jgi:hypothetical protein
MLILLVVLELSESRRIAFLHGILHRDIAKCGGPPEEFGETELSPQSNFSTE